MLLYPSPISGPIKSRRLGVSLGVNVNPDDGKLCTFDCIYCEVGYNASRHASKPRPSRQYIAQCLEQKLSEMSHGGMTLDVITFSGNGEPTAHPHFAEIMGDTVALRDRFFPKARVAVLSNGTMAHRPDVHEALLMADDNILKLDTVSQEYIERVDRPVSRDYDVARVIETMRSFEGHVTVQTMFMRGVSDDGRSVDNTGERFVRPWIDALLTIRPRQVMIYTIDRETPCPTLLKATREQLDAIRDMVIQAGFECIVGY